MLGKCPKCEIKFKLEALQALKKGDSAQCNRCGKYYMPKPFWIYLKLFLLFLPFIVPLFKVKILTIIACIITFFAVALYHEVQAYMPLVEDKMI